MRFLPNGGVSLKTINADNEKLVLPDSGVRWPTEMPNKPPKLPSNGVTSQRNESCGMKISPNDRPSRIEVTDFYAFF